MNKKNKVIVALVLIIGVFAVITSAKKDDKMMVPAVDGSAMVDINSETAITDVAIEKEASNIAKGTYEAYSPEKIAMAENGDVVIFFHASWCPSCRGLSSNIEENMNAIPGGVSILKADYDKETELKKKYGVTSQHTLVQVDKDGNMIKKWSGGSKLSSLLSEIQ